MTRPINARIAMGVAAVATAAVLVAPGVAAAHDSDGRGARSKRHHHWLTDAQKSCLSDQGITFSKDRSQDRARYRDPAERMKLWAALQTCGIVPKPAVAPAAVDARPSWWGKVDAARWFAAAKWRDHDGSDFRGSWDGPRDDDRRWDDHDHGWGDRDRRWGDGDRRWGDGDHDGGGSGRSWGDGGRGR